MVLFFYLYISAAIYLILHYAIFHSRLALFKVDKKKPFRTGVSVIICAKNEAENLKKNLPAVLDQDFKLYEVIVVNDNSSDETAEVLQLLKKTSRKLKVITLKEEEDGPGKKAALLKAIAKARSQYLLLTDADCEPASNNWLKSMSAHFRTKEIVLGFSPMRNSKGLPGKLAQWDTLQTAQQYLSFAIAGLPYMGVGRNMGYTKGLFYNSDQFKSHQKLASGDDDLFIGQMATRYNTRIEIGKDTFCPTDAPANLNSWWKKKRRHLTTARYYKLHIALLLGSFGVAQLLFYLLFFTMLFSGAHLLTTISLLALKFAVQLVMLLPAARKLKQQKILWLFPLWEFLNIIFLSLIHIQNFFAPKRTRWN